MGRSGFEKGENECVLLLDHHLNGVRVLEDLWRNRHTRMEFQSAHDVKEAIKIGWNHLDREVNVHRDTLDAMQHASDTAPDNEINMRIG